MPPRTPARCRGLRARATWRFANRGSTRPDRRRQSRLNRRPVPRAVDLPSVAEEGKGFRPAAAGSERPAELHSCYPGLHLGRSHANVGGRDAEAATLRPRDAEGRRGPRFGPAAPHGLGPRRPTVWARGAPRFGPPRPTVCAATPRPGARAAVGVSAGPGRLLYFGRLGTEGPRAANANRQGVHVAARRRAVRPVRRTTTFPPPGAAAASTEGQSTQVPGRSAEGFLVSRGSRRDDRRGEHRRED